MKIRVLIFVTAIMVFLFMGCDIADNGDGRRVIGEIDSDGRVTILSEELASEFIVLQRIN